MNVKYDKLKNALPESVKNQIIPIELLSIIHVYIPKILTNINIHETITDYLSDDKNIKQQIKAKYGKINNWDVSQVTNMKYLFFNYKNFNEDISNWDVSNVTNMEAMFREARSFDQPLSNWNVSNIVNMEAMFQEARSFNQPLNNWDVSNVKHMDCMFFGAETFNQPLNSWDISNIQMQDMRNIFLWAISFHNSNNYEITMKDWIKRNDEKIARCRDALTASNAVVAALEEKVKIELTKLNANREIVATLEEKVKIELTKLNANNENVAALKH